MDAESFRIFRGLFENKRILVTGGVGSIGSEIVRQLLKFNPKVIRVFDIDETRLFELEHELAGFENVRYLVGDVRDKERLLTAMENIDLVFHVAALKHVASCEYNPFEAIKTNVLGTQNVIEVAMERNVEKVINVSTDKAAAVFGTMGATKLLAERLVTAAEHYKGDKRTVFASVRFGNVLDSRGSVIPVFKDQIKSKKCVTLTHQEMTRFVMSIPKAVELIFKAVELAKGGEVFIFKMPALRVIDLAEVMIDELTPAHGYSRTDVEIKFIGVRPGERIHEYLMTEEESKNVLETDEMFIILPQIRTPFSNERIHVYPSSRPAEIKDYRSNNGLLLKKEEIREMLKKENIM